MHRQALTLNHIAVQKVRFNYKTETWESGRLDLPVHNRRHVLLTPKDLLTKDDTWINKTDLFDDFDQIPQAIPELGASSADQ